MAIDASLLLQGQGVQVPVPDLGKTFLQAANIRRAGLHDAMLQAELMAYQRARQQEAAVQGIYAAHADRLAGNVPGAGPMGLQAVAPQTAPAEPPGAMAPEAATFERAPVGVGEDTPTGLNIEIVKAGPTPPTPQTGATGTPTSPYTANSDILAKLYRIDRKAATAFRDDTYKFNDTHLKYLGSALEMQGQLLQGVTSQEQYDGVRAYAKDFLPQMYRRMPARYDPKWVAEAMQKTMSVADTIKTEHQGLNAYAQAQNAATNRLREEREALKPAGTDTLAEELRALYGSPNPSIPGGYSQEQYQAALDAKTARQERVNAARGENAARIETTLKPLEGDAEKAVSGIGALLRLSSDARRLHKEDFTGPVVGRTGGVREATGVGISPEEVDFRRTVSDIRSLIGTLRAGLALTPTEVARLEATLPNVNQPPEVFQTRLQSFERALETIREERLRTATTPRAQLRQESPRTTPLAGGKRMSEANIAQAMQQTGRSRADILAAARAKGYAVPER